MTSSMSESAAQNADERASEGSDGDCGTGGDVLAVCWTTAENGAMC